MGKRTGSIWFGLFFNRKGRVYFGKGPIGKFFSEDSIKEIMKISGAAVGDSIFLSCGNDKELESILSLAREKIANDLNLIDENKFAFCWIVDYPMFEMDQKLKKLSLATILFQCHKGILKN